MAEIPEEKIAEVRDRLDIVAIIGRSVALKQAGRFWKGLCPFHQEKTPSFNVDPHRKLYHCFGCKAGGDVIRFVMDYEGKTFPETMRALAEDAGVALPEAAREKADPKIKASLRRREALLDANTRASELFSAWLNRGEAGAPGRSHLADRGIGDAVSTRFGLGFAPLRNDLGKRLVRSGVEENVLREAGLLVQGDRGVYERFRGRLMIPIRDQEGRTIAYGARLVEGDHPAKYMNSPETPLYRKSETLFGLPEARPHLRRTGMAIVVEGYFDVIALAQAGIENVVATCGTALTREHCRALARHAGDVVLVFDGDAAGSDAARRAHEVGKEVPGVALRAVSLPLEDDPDSFVRREGPEAFMTLCASSRPLAEVLIDRALTGVGPAIEDRVRAIAQVRPHLEAMGDPLVHRLYIQRIADRLGMDERALSQHLRSGAMMTRHVDRSHQRPEEPVVSLPGDEEALCLLLLQYPELARRAPVEACMSDLVDDRSRFLVEAVVHASCQCNSSDVGAVLERVSDHSTRTRWREHVVRMTELAVTREDDFEQRLLEAARKLELVLQRLARKAERRQREALAKETSLVSDPVERARRIQASRGMGSTPSAKARRR